MSAFRVEPVVAQPPDRGGELGVLGRHRPAFPGRDDLSRMEREAAHRSEPAAGHATPARAERSGSVLDQQHLRRHRVLQRLPVERPPEEMNREHGLGARRDRVIDPREVEVEGRWVDVDEHRRRTGEPDDARGRREGVRGNDDLISLADPERQHGQVERGSAVRDRDGVLDSARVRDELLELLHLRAHRQRTRLEDLANGLQLGLAELRER